MSDWGKKSQNCVTQKKKLIFKLKFDGKEFGLWIYFTIPRMDALKTHSNEINLILISFQMNHLYSMFAKQVQSYCKNQNNENVSQCKMNMMMHGVNKLNDMEESHLDAMDPYQRNANNIRKLFLFLTHKKITLDDSKSQ